MAVSLGVFLLLIRARLMTFPWVHSVAARVPRAVLAAYEDLAYVTGIALLFLILLRAARNSETAKRLLWISYVALALGSLLSALANLKIVPMLGRPLNYRWLYYSDFLDSQDVRNAIRDELSGRLVGTAAACAAGLLATAFLLHRGLRLLAGRFGIRRLAAVGIGSLTLYFAVGGVLIRRQSWPRSKLENPVVAFTRSLFVRRPPALLSMKTSVGYGDFEPPPARSPDSSPIARRNAGRVRNVLVFVLESVPARYLPAYGGPYPVTPVLQTHSGDSAIFTDIYSPAATTSAALVSLLLSIDPWISYRSLTREHPDVAFPSLSSELAGRGYRTAFFNSADLRYQTVGDFLSHRQFQTVADYRDLHCRGPVLHTSVQDRLLDAADDGCVVDAFSRWIHGSPSEPFFAVLWTMMTHQPYFVFDAEKDFGVGDPAFNRYLNALRHSDQMIGKLIGILRELRLDDSTLIVVLGDHGETFGQHDQRGHGDIYEPSLHVPLILLNPVLFHGERIGALGGLRDVAPTVLDVLGVAPPAVWQGRSLFRPDRPSRVYFFAPFGDHLFGFREGGSKVIFDATEDRFEVYDLSRDPGETTNLARSMPRETEIARQRIAAWVQYQDRMMKDLLKDGAR